MLLDHRRHLNVKSGFAFVSSMWKTQTKRAKHEDPYKFAQNYHKTGL